MKRSSAEAARNASAAVSRYARESPPVPSFTPPYQRTNDRGVVQIRAFDRAEDRLSGGAGRLAGVGAARANVAMREEPERPAEMRRVVMTFRQHGELREEFVLRFDVKRDAEELGAIDLLPKLGGRGERSVVIEHGLI